MYLLSLNNNFGSLTYNYNNVYESLIFFSLFHYHYYMTVRCTTLTTTHDKVLACIYFSIV